MKKQFIVIAALTALTAQLQGNWWHSFTHAITHNPVTRAITHNPVTKETETIVHTAEGTIISHNPVVKEFAQAENTLKNRISGHKASQPVKPTPPTPPASNKINLLNKATYGNYGKEYAPNDPVLVFGVGSNPADSYQSNGAMTAIFTNIEQVNQYKTTKALFVNATGTLRNVYPIDATTYLPQVDAQGDPIVYEVAANQSILLNADANGDYIYVIQLPGIPVTADNLANFPLYMPIADYIYAYTK